MAKEEVTVEDVTRFLFGYSTPTGRINTHRANLAADLYEWIESGFDENYLRD